MKNYWNVDRGKYWIQILCLRFDMDKVKRGDDRVNVLFDFGIGWLRKPRLDSKKHSLYKLGNLHSISPSLNIDHLFTYIYEENED